MHFAREGYPWIYGFGGASLFFGLVDVPVLAAVLLLLALFVAFFFRDPDRTPPDDERVVVSPADGRVVTVELDCAEQRFVGATMTRVGVFLSPLDVHVNRLPASGTVETVEHRPGKFHAAFAPDAVDVNEQTAVVMRDACGRKLLLVQVAGMVARRIVCRLSGGEQVRQGDRYGMIKLGSRIDVYCQHDVTVRVEVGQRVRAGETVLAEYPPESGGSQ